MTLTVHHLNESRSHRVIFLLEELGVPYDIKNYSRDPKTLLAPPSLKAIHPLGKSPVVTDGAEVLAETGHIIDTLIERHDGRLRPEAGTPGRLLYGYYLHYAEGSLAPLMLLSLVFARLPQQMPFPLRPVASLISRGLDTQFLNPQLSTHLGYLDSELSARPWFAGAELSGADIIMSFPLQALRASGRLKDRPHLTAWLTRLEARPAWARTIAKGGPLTFKFR